MQLPSSKETITMTILRVSCAILMPSLLPTNQKDLRVVASMIASYVEAVVKLPKTNNNHKTPTLKGMQSTVVTSLEVESLVYETSKLCSFIYKDVETALLNQKSFILFLLLVNLVMVKQCPLPRLARETNASMFVSQ